MADPIFEKSVALPLDYVLTARARPSSVPRTVLRLLPWAVYAMMPPGRRARAAMWFARRVSPLVKQRGG
ncbi:MAG TPA: hypothetical protein VEZ14_05295 [Dehalococcoidia bacterium]|nr:hypothetical protein [Dehalococcoidia bacterium]